MVSNTRPRSDSSSASKSSVGYQTRALARALAILDAFTAEQPALTTKDLHLKLDLPKPTISRLASMLERHGFLRRSDGTYELGPKTFELGSLYVRQHRVFERFRLPLQRLSAESKQTSCLAELAGSSIVHLLVSRSPMPVQFVTETGSRAPAHATGLGKALLASIEADEVDRLLESSRLERFTANTICDREELFAELDRIRKRGYAIDDEEFAEGLKCIAIAIELEHVGLVAISVSGASADFTANTIPRFAKLLRRSAVTLNDEAASAAEYSEATGFGSFEALAG
jgi:IclR family acetate operon transcriptional repressor